MPFLADLPVGVCTYIKNCAFTLGIHFKDQGSRKYRTTTSTRLIDDVYLHNAPEIMTGRNQNNIVENYSSSTNSRVTKLRSVDERENCIEESPSNDQIGGEPNIVRQKGNSDEVYC